MNNPLAQDVLAYWHGVEFFNYYDLDDQIDKTRAAKRAQFYLEGDAWSAQWEQYQGRPRAIYLLPFDLSEVTALASATLGDPQTELHKRRDEEFNPQGATCFARLPILEDGTPNFALLSVSTLPWAAGMLAAQRLGELCAVTFEAQVADLAEKIQTIWSCSTEDTVTPGIIAQFAALLTKWAGFVPAAGNLAWVEVHEPAKPNQSKRSVPEQQNLVAPVQRDLPILNSFYYHDLKFAAEALQHSHAPHPLHTYLAAQWPAKLDLDSAQGQREVLATLEPALTNAGRWPSEPHQLQSLMQQFALNKMRAMQPGQVLSVNGPPGTGKTTLVKDLIADLVVQRARVLASLGSARDGLAGEEAEIGLRTGRYKFPKLIAGLTGFEILVGSSNNGAVENLSLELPQLEGIDPSRRASLRYFDWVANKYAGSAPGKPWRAPLKPVWGLMSAALGNWDNRQRLAQIFSNNAKKPGDKVQSSFLKSEDVDIEAWMAAGALDYWNFAKQPRSKVPTFAQAQANFRQALQQHETDVSLLNTLSGKWQRFLSDWQAQAASLELQTDLSKEAALQAAAGELGTTAARWQRRAQLASLKLWWPGFRWLMRWLSKAHYVEWQHATEQALRAAVLLDDIGCIVQLDKQCGGVQLWDGKDLASRRNQESAFWQGSAYNQNRNALFAAAMQLHQAFFLEAAPKDAKLAMSKMLTNRINYGNPLFLWQWFFMLVPVVSSTFASVRNQFRGIDPGSLGWLIIDEAGQAVPQAAVGALLRTQRAVVVGDPLQIAPVVPLPTRLLLKLGELWLGTHAPDYAVHQQSVQTLADRVHGYGVKHPLNKESYIGIPLVMHRRCDNPMFNIANEIAYDKRMLHAKSPDIKAHPVLGCSAWWHVTGPATQGKYVDAQGTLLLARLVALYLAELADGNTGLPDLYVITPFREVKQGLMALLLERSQWQAALAAHGVPMPDNLNQLHAQIGTVHTFQGKEADIVFFVLGCDASQGGAAGWAASSPNLLNVALTRARKHCYIIGDQYLWGGLASFDVAMRTMGSAL